MWIALLPLMYPMICETECFGGMDNIMWIVLSGHNMPLLDPALFLPRQFAEHRPDFFSQFSEERLSAALRNEYDVILTFPFGMTLTLVIIH